MLPSTVKKMSWPNCWNIDEVTKTVTLEAGESLEERNKLLEDTLVAERDRKTFKLLDGWGNELYPVLGPNEDLVLSMERAASTLFGIVTYGVHLIAFEDTKDGLNIWVSRRSKSKLTYGGMLDSCVGGSLTVGESPFECLVREADEEASFPQTLIREKAKACGSVKYFLIRDERAGGEVGMMQPECQFVYEIDLTGVKFEPTPNDQEVEQFQSYTTNGVKAAMAAGEFKPNCALIMMDFFIRHGILTKDNEKDYDEIVSRIHRELDFPVADFSNW
jgi:8-oxo-dGTP pyrophosphatase MutT (NUDIX family)